MILGTGAMAVKAARRFIGACAVNRGYKTIKTPGLSLALLLCLCVSSWAECVPLAEASWVKIPIARVCYITGSCTGTEYAGEVTADPGGSYNHNGSWLSDDVIPDEYCRSGYCYCTSDWRVQCTKTTYRLYKYRCDSQAEADSAYCAQNPTAEGCVEEDVPENCQEDYSQCVSMGGVWKKIGSTSAGCQSECDLCGSKGKTNVMNAIANVCCKQGLAPPDSAVQCYMPASSGVGMTSSVMNDKNNTYQCGQLTTSDGGAISENQALYKRFCIDGDEYEEQADTNDVGGESSSAGEAESSASGTSFGTELDALGGIYGVLDTIRDTLVKRLTPATEEIRDCLYNFKLCAQLDSLYVDWSAMPKDSTWFYIDTGLVKYLRPFMDASVALDSSQLKAIRKLDTNALKQLRLDSALLENDTSTRRAVNSGFEGVLKNDTVTRRAVNRLDTTVVSLDSSLRKGIREGTDNLIDSMDRYLGRVDSAIGAVGSNGTPLGDSLGKLIGILGGDTGSVGSGQYGDSASAYGDSIRRWIREGDGKWDSAFGATEREWGVDTIDGLYDSSFAYGTCHGDDCPPCTDSDCLGKITPGILKYGDSIAAQLGDSLVKNVKAQEDSLPTMWDSAMVKLREVSFFSTFDSTFLANIGAKIPNTNTCPEDCFRQQVDGRYAYVPYNMTLDWKLCRPIAPGVLNGLNAFDILKLLARVLTVVTCLFILMWEVSSRRGGGMGL